MDVRRSRFAVAFVVITLTVAACGGGGEVAPTPGAGERVTFATADGLTLEARRFGDGPEWVVLAHMLPAEMSSWFDVAGMFAERGYTAVAFDFRGYGDSEGERTAYRVDVDTIAAIDFAVAEGATAVWVVGASMGGVGALAAAAERDVAGVVTLSAPREFAGVDALAATASSDAPKLFMATTQDGDYAEVAVALRDASAGTASVRVLEGSGAHGTDMLAQYPEIAPYAIVAFVEGAGN